MTYCQQKCMYCKLKWTHISMLTVYAVHILAILNGCLLYTYCQQKWAHCQQKEHVVYILSTQGTSCVHTVNILCIH